MLFFKTCILTTNLNTCSARVVTWQTSLSSDVHYSYISQSTKN